MFPKLIAGLLQVTLCVACAQEYQLTTLVSGVASLGPVPALQVSVGHVSGVVTDRSGDVYFSSLKGCVYKLDLEAPVRLAKPRPSTVATKVRGLPCELS